jgi:hypothetical protein
MGANLLYLISRSGHRSAETRPMTLLLPKPRRNALHPHLRPHCIRSHGLEIDGWEGTQQPCAGQGSCGCNRQAPRACHRVKGCEVEGDGTAQMDIVSVAAAPARPGAGGTGCSLRRGSYSQQKKINNKIDAHVRQGTRTHQKSLVDEVGSFRLYSPKLATRGSTVLPTRRRIKRKFVSERF